MHTHEGLYMAFLRSSGFWVFALVLASLFSSGVFAQTAPIADWKFNEGSGNNFQDSSGNGFHGTLYGPTWLPANNCVEGTCLFSNDNDVGLIPLDQWGKGPRFFSDTAQNGVTETAWVYWDGEFHGPATWYYNKIVAKQWSNFDLFFSGDSIGCTLRDDDHPDFVALANVHFQAKTWTHVACVFDKTAQKLRLYVNGQLSTEINTQFDRFFSGGTTSIGILNDPATPGSAYHFTGRLDEVKMWNRSLSSTEIAAEYAAVVPTTPACGDRFVTGPETCDAGQIWCTTPWANQPLWNYRGTATCNATCTGWQDCQPTEFCGDNVTNGTEVCDHSTQACTTPGGSAGTQDCLPSCLGWTACVNPNDQLDTYAIGDIHFPEKFGFNRDQAGGTVLIDVTKLNFEPSDNSPLHLHVIVRDETGALVTEGDTADFTFAPSSPGVGRASAVFTVPSTLTFDDLHTYTLFATLPAPLGFMAGPTGEKITQNNSNSKTFVAVKPATTLNVSDNPSWMGFVLVALVLGWLFYPRPHTAPKKTHSSSKRARTK